MKNVKCDHCGQTFPFNDTFKIAENVFCTPCAEHILKEQKDIPRERIQRQVDRTVCANCKADSGNAELPLLAGLPVCPQCETLFRHRPYPGWIKVAFAGVVVFVAFSFFWNWRFVQAYAEIRSVKAAMQADDVEKAAKLLRDAATRVPEKQEISAMASFYEGILMMDQEKDEEALKLFTSCKGNLPSTWPVDEMINNAQTGIAFDKKDYDKFLEIALAMQKKFPNASAYNAQVASAYACKYAVTGDEQYKKLSLENLEKSKALDKKSGLSQKEGDNYEDRILYRLETRDIISRNEFKAKFPNGYKQQKELTK